MLDVHEFVSFRFKDGVSPSEQANLMAQLNAIAARYAGFKSREYFYSAADNRWIDHVVWTDEAHAQNASEDIMKSPAAVSVFQHMDETSMLISHYHRLGQQVGSNQA